MVKASMHLTNFVGAGVTVEQAELYRISVKIKPAFTFKDGVAVNYDFAETQNILNGELTVPNMETEYLGEPLPWSIGVTVESRAGGQGSAYYPHLKTFPPGTVEGQVVEFVDMLDVDVVQLPEFGPTWAEQARLDAVAAEASRVAAETAQAEAVVAKNAAEAVAAVTVDDVVVVGDNLIATRTNGTTKDAGVVRGPQGIQGVPGLPGVNAVSNDSANATLIGTSGTATRTALTGWGLAKYTSAAPGGNQEVWSDVAVRGALKGKFFGAADHIGNYRQPFGVSMTYDAANLTGASGGDKVGMQLNVIFKGDFTPDQSRPGGAPKWLWGANDFIIIGDGTTPLLGITDAWSRLTEIHLRSPNMTLNNVHAVIAESGFDSTATGSTITGWFASLKASGPTNTVGASVANAASLYITSPLAGVATNQYAIFVAGQEKSLFGGDVHLNQSSGEPKTFNAWYGGFKGVTMTLGNPGTASAAQLTVVSQADANITAWFKARGGQTGDVLRLGADTVVRSRFDKRGRLGMVDTSAPADADIATSEQMFYVANTAGAPKLMLKGKDSAGAVFTRSIALASQSGTTANRPSAATVGVDAHYFDTTLVKPLWSDGTVWRDALGAAA